MFDDWHSDASWHNLRENKDVDPHGDKYPGALPGNDFVGQYREGRDASPTGPSILEKIKQLFINSEVMAKDHRDLCNRVARLERAVGLGPKD